MDRLNFENTGKGAAFDISVQLWVYNENPTGLDVVPRFKTETLWRPQTVPAGESLFTPGQNILCEFRVGQEVLKYEEQSEFEFFTKYQNLLGEKYVTHVSIDLSCQIRDSYIGKDTWWTALKIRAGILQRHYKVYIPIWIELWKRKRAER